MNPHRQSDLCEGGEAGFGFMLSPRVYMCAPLVIPSGPPAEGEERPKQTVTFPAVLTPRNVYTGDFMKAEILTPGQDTPTILTETATIGKENITAQFDVTELKKPGLYPLRLTFHGTSNVISLNETATFAGKASLVSFEPKVLIAGRKQEVKVRGWFPMDDGIDFLKEGEHAQLSIEGLPVPVQGMPHERESDTETPKSG